MADVVQQRGRHELVGGVVAGREGGALEGVVDLRDVLVVAVGAEPPVEVEHLVDRGGAGHARPSGTGRPWKSSINDTCTLPSARPPRRNCSSFSR